LEFGGDMSTSNPYKKHDSETKAKRVRYYVFALSNGQIEYVTTKAEATSFADDYSDLIQEKLTFETKAELEAFKKTAANETPRRAERIEVDDKSDDEVIVLDPKKAKKMENIGAAIDDDRPSDRIEFHYKTAARSGAVVFVMRFLTTRGRDDWRLKADHVAISLSNMMKEFPHDNPVLTFAFKNFKYGQMRDLEGSQNKALTNEWKSPDTGRVSYFPNHVAYSFFTVPDDLKSKEEETVFIEGTLRALGKALIRLMQDQVFRYCFKRAVNNDRIWAAITDSKNVAKHYLTFVKAAKIKVIPCSNFNLHLIKADANLLSEILYNHNKPKAKYPSLKSDSSSDDDSKGDEKEELVVKQEPDDQKPTPEPRRLQFAEESVNASHALCDASDGADSDCVPTTPPQLKRSPGKRGRAVTEESDQASTPDTTPKRSPRKRKATAKASMNSDSD
jgi:hypothetical protein